MPLICGDNNATERWDVKGGNYEENQQMSIHFVDGMHAF